MSPHAVALIASTSHGLYGGPDVAAPLLTESHSGRWVRTLPCGLGFATCILRKSPARQCQYLTGQLSQTHGPSRRGLHKHAGGRSPGRVPVADEGLLGPGLCPPPGQAPRAPFVLEVTGEAALSLPLAWVPTSSPRHQGARQAGRWGQGAGLSAPPEGRPPSQTPAPPCRSRRGGEGC